MELDEKILDSPTINLSVSKNGQGKVYTYDFKWGNINSLNKLRHIANRFSVASPQFKNGHRKQSNIVEGGNLILIDCDEPGQAEKVEIKLQCYDYLKVPSASNLEANYKWHFFVPTEDPLSTNSAEFKWQVEQFFKQVGITNDLIDTTGSYDIARQFAPASIKIDPKQADELSVINDTKLQVPILSGSAFKDIPKELQNLSNAVSVSPKMKSVKVSELPDRYLWYRKEAVSYETVVDTVESETSKTDEFTVVSGFGCPFNNPSHTSDPSVGYGFGFMKNGRVIIKCTGNQCKDHPYFVIPRIIKKQINEIYKDPKISPVHPFEFAKMVKERIHQLEPKFQFGDAMMSGFYYYGSVYNEILNRNLTDQSPIRTVIPAPTGSAKSVSAKLYMSYIARHGYSGLLVLGKVSQMIEAVKEINEMAGRKIAVTNYAITQNHPVAPERVEISELKDYPVVVISHSLFLSRSYDHEAINQIKLHNGQNRQAVIIDEKINFRRTVSFSTDELKDAIGLVKNIKGWDNIDKTFTMIIEGKQTTPQEPGDSRITISKHPDITGVMKIGIRELRNGKGYVGLKKDRRYEDREQQDRDTLMRLMDRVAYVFNPKHQNIAIPQGKYTTYSVNVDLTNFFGSTVILDATAKAEPIYRSHKINRSDIEEIGMPDGIRSYKNATLNVMTSKKAKQSKYHFTQHKKKKTLDKAIETYLSILYPLIEDGSKLLVCVFKEYEELFRSKCQSDNISFIHWGEHEGRNDFSDYSKAVAIGWFRKPESKYYQDLDAIREYTGEYDAMYGSIDADVEEMIIGGLSADIVQFFNRTRSRVVIDNNGNCAKTDFYMIDDGSAEDLLYRIRNEMPELTMKEWNVDVLEYPTIKKSADEQRGERVIKYLLTRQGDTINGKTIQERFNISKKRLSDLLRTNVFKILLEESRIILTVKRGRHGGIYFSVPSVPEPLETDLFERRGINMLLN